MHEAIVEKLYNEYIANGFISEDKVFDTLQKESIPLFDIEYVCDRLLDRGAIILEENDEADDEAGDEQTDLTQTDYRAVYSEIIERDKGLCDIVEYMRNVQPPQRREWQNLLPQAQNGNLYARNRVFEMYMRVAAKIALQYANRYGLPLADTMQDGFYGLFIAIDKFEYGRQDHFTTYFPFWVRQRIMREAQIKDVPFCIPVHVKDRLFVISDLKKSHSCPECYKNTACQNLILEITKAFGCDENEAKRLYSLTQPYQSIEHLLDMLDADDEISIGQGFYDCTYLSYDEEDDIIDKIDADKLHRLLNEYLKTLSTKEEKVLKLRYGLDDGKAKTLEEVGNQLSVTRERIRQIEEKAFRKLRHPTRANQLRGYIESFRSYKNEP